MCETCPFRKGGWEHVRSLLEERALNEATPICHSTGQALTRHKGEKLKAHLCRGARQFQLIFFAAIGYISAPTDEAWETKVVELGLRRKKDETKDDTGGKQTAPHGF